MKTLTATTVTRTSKFEFTTDDLEDFVRGFLQSKNIDISDVDFTWNIGQWVSLDVTVTSTERREG